MKSGHHKGSRSKINDVKCTTLTNCENDKYENDDKVKVPVCGNQGPIIMVCGAESECNQGHESIRNKKPAKSNCNVIPAPLIDNGEYNSRNCVLQILYGCREFTTAISDVHNRGEAVNSKGTEREISFFNRFTQLIHEIKNYPCEGKANLFKTQKDFYKYFDHEGDVEQGFAIILFMINNATKMPADQTSDDDSKAAEAFNKHKNRNNGFIFDLFYGQMYHSLTCRICKFMVKEYFQLFKTLPLWIPSCTGGVDLMDCVRCFLEETEISMDGRMDCRCEGGSEEFYTQWTITHSPKYLFIYLIRRSYFAKEQLWSKNNTFVKCGEMIKFPTTSGEVPYRLISVIDHLGACDYGHYYCKCNYESNHWWLISDGEVEDLGSDADNVVTENTLVLMYKRLA